MKARITQARLLRRQLSYQKHYAESGQMAQASKLFQKIEKTIQEMVIAEATHKSILLTNHAYTQIILNTMNKQIEILNTEIQRIFETEKKLLKKELIETRLEQQLDQFNIN